MTHVTPLKDLAICTMLVSIAGQVISTGPSFLYYKEPFHSELVPFGSVCATSGGGGALV